MTDTHIENIKNSLGQYAASLIENDMIVGLGSGSTSYYFIKHLINRVRNENLKVKTISSSTETLKLAKEGNLTILSDSEFSYVDIAIDGADEIDHNGCLIKGGGGALLREKIIISSAKRVVIIADYTKFVDKLGSFGLPIEISQFGSNSIINKLKEFNLNGKIRQRNNTNFITDNSNYIFDISFNDKIESPGQLHSLLVNIPGVIDTGIFIYPIEITCGLKNGSIQSISQRKSL